MQSLLTTPTAKRCPRCESTKPVTEFNRDKSKPDGLQACCRDCRKEIKLDSRCRNPETERRWESKQPGAKAKAENQETRRRLADCRNRYQEHEESLTLEHRSMFFNEASSKWVKRQKEKRWRLHNPEKAKAYREAWDKASRNTKRGHRKAYRDRHKNDPLHIAKRRIRGRTYEAFRRAGFKKTGKTAALLGCSWDHLRKHIESQFVKGMNWKNRHLWHVDHIVPLASARTAEELARLAHWTNLAPLWIADNLSKKDKIPTCQPELTMSYA